jgi:hypothetical protein
MSSITHITFGNKGLSCVMLTTQAVCVHHWSALVLMHTPVTSPPPFVSGLWTLCAQLPWPRRTIFFLNVPLPPSHFLHKRLLCHLPPTSMFSTNSLSLLQLCAIPAHPLLTPGKLPVLMVPSQQPAIRSHFLLNLMITF